jgi:hypothetical protein
VLRGTVMFPKERLARTPQVRRCAREDVSHGTRPQKIRAHGRLTAQFNSSLAGASHRTAQPQNPASIRVISARTRLTSPPLKRDGL